MPEQSKHISIQAPGKINLTLAVLGRRPDGFHEIESWVVKIGWFDQLTFVAAPVLSLTVGGEAVGVAADDSNLVLRAARALAEASDQTSGAAITLEKRIPVGAGLGGGSSDAAATLQALNGLWDLNWTDERLQDVGAGIGSDVPLFLDESTAVVLSGRGERVEPLATSPRGWVAVIVPAYSISTADVYRTVGASEVPRRSASRPWMGPSRPAAQMQSELVNDLQAAAIAVEPRLARLYTCLDGLEGRRVHMTGSGSCLFALFDDRSEAQAWGQEALARADQSIRIEVVAML